MMSGLSGQRWWGWAAVAAILVPGIPGCSGGGGDGDTVASTTPPDFCLKGLCGWAEDAVYFDLGLAESFFDFPWPSDLRIDEAGHPVMDGFPNPEDSDLLRVYIASMEQDVTGFGNNSPIYFRFRANVRQDRLPVLPVDSLETDSTVFIVNVDKSSASFGERTPLHFEYFSDDTMYSPSRLLAVAPDWGFPLEPSTTYAAVVLTTLGDEAGRLLEPPPEVLELMEGGGSGLEPELYAPLLEYLDSADVPRDLVATATVFTTQDPVTELGRIREAMHRSLPVPELDPYLESPLWYVPEDPDYERVNEEEEYLYPASDNDPYDQAVSGSRPYLQFEGRYRAPNYQEGEPPYAETGGGIQFDEQGDPIVQVAEEPLRFCLTVPKGEQPENGWPLTIYAHGTGGSYKSMLTSGEYSAADMLTPRGVAVISIDEPLHGERAPEGTDPELMSFNFLNPDAARSNFRQAAIDVFYLTWLCRTSLKVPADVSPTGEAIRFDPERMTFVGHSHGGLSGALLVPFETDLQGAVLSEAGGGLSLTILLRKDYVDFAALFRTVLGMPEEDPLDEFHPVMAMVQTLVDITDPINYSPLYVHRPLDGRARTVLQTEGFQDEATPPETIEAMIVAGHLPLLEPIGRMLNGLELLGVEPVPRPASGNVTGPDGVPATLAVAQFPDDNHYAVSRDYEAATLYADFIASIGYTGVPILE